MYERVLCKIYTDTFNRWVVSCVIRCTWLFSIGLQCDSIVRIIYMSFHSETFCIEIMQKKNEKKHEMNKSGNTEERRRRHIFFPWYSGFWKVFLDKLISCCEYENKPLFTNIHFIIPSSSLETKLTRFKSFYFKQNISNEFVVSYVNIKIHSKLILALCVCDFFGWYFSIWK